MSSKLTGGPLREFIYGGIPLRPSKDGEPEIELSGTDYTNNASPNGDYYAEGEEKVGMVQQECSMTTDEFTSFIRLKDGTSRSGTATAINGDVLSLNCIIEGEHKLTNGKVTVVLSGSVRLQ